MSTRWGGGGVRFLIWRNDSGWYLPWEYKCLLGSTVDGRRNIRTDNQVRPERIGIRREIQHRSAVEEIALRNAASHGQREKRSLQQLGGFPERDVLLAMVAADND